MCLRFVIFWILVIGLITPFPVSRGTETLSDLQFALEIISKSDKATMKLMGTAFYKQCASYEIFKIYLVNKFKFVDLCRCC